jgi:hypothetical protein
MALSALTPAPRPGRGVGGAPVELHLHLDDSQRGPPHLGARPPVDHHGRVHVLEDPGLHEPNLARAAFLGGRADHLDPAREGQGRERGGQRRPRARPRGRDDVVAAGVPDAGQRVVLAQDRDGGAVAGLDGAAEGGVHAAHPLLHLEALPGQEVAEPAARLHFLVAQLGVRVDLTGEGLELVGQPVDGLADRFLGVAHGGTSRLRATERRRRRRWDASDPATDPAPGRSCSAGSAIPTSAAAGRRWHRRPARARSREPAGSGRAGGNARGSSVPRRARFRSGSYERAATSAGRRIRPRERAPSPGRGCPPAAPSRTSPRRRADSRPRGAPRARPPRCARRTGRGPAPRRAPSW